MKQIDKIDTKIKFKSFGKTRPKQKKLVANKSKNKTQAEKDNELKQKEDKRVERRIELIKTKNNGRAGNVFRIRKDIAGPKKPGQETSSIRDPETGELHVAQDEIKAATVKYCAGNLKGNKPDETVEETVTRRK